MNYKTILKTLGTIALSYLPFALPSYAQQQAPVSREKIEGLIQKIRARQMIQVNKSGTDTIYTCVGYNPEQGMVTFKFHTQEGGVLETEIEKSDLIPGNLNSDEFSITNRLLVIEGFNSEGRIDGIPEAVGIKMVTIIGKDPSPSLPGSITIEGRPFPCYETDPGVKQAVNEEYLNALTKTELATGKK